MAARYEIIKDFLDISQGTKVDFEPDALSLNPAWIIVVWPFAEEVTFYRNKMKSYDTDPSQAVKVDAPLIITSDCRQMQVQQSKDSFMGTLTAQLQGGGTNYLTKIFPGNWVFAWMFQNAEDAENVLQRIGTLDVNNPPNEFMDGLKFVGRVSRLSETLTQSPEGKRTVAYSLQAHSFTEFESQIFYEPSLSNTFQQTQGTFFAALDQNLLEFFTPNATVTTSRAVPFLLAVLLGRGIPPAIQRGAPPSPNIPNPPQIAYGPTAEDAGVINEEAPYGYLIPREVGALLGKSDSSKPSGILSAADIDEIWMGIQKYTSGMNSGAVAPMSPQGIFTPDGLGPAKGQPNLSSNHQFTPDPVLGTFVPNYPQLTGNKSMWTIFNEFLNPAVNEMYACLKANQNGRVVPLVTVRQIPFSSNAFSDSIAQVPGADGPSIVISNQYLSETAAITGSVPVLTRFLELPRWHAHPLLVVSKDIGRSNSKRFNFVHVYPSASLLMAGNTPQTLIADNPPIQDLADNKRSGFRMTASTVECSPKDVTANGTGKGASVWMALISDWSMGMHLTLDGIINLHGVQAPIPPGDNFEFDSVVYHIESVTHTCQIQPDGKKSFYTTLTIDHGMRSDDSLLPTGIQLQGQTPDQGMYAGVIDTPQDTYFPGFTYDAQSSQLPDAPPGAEAYPAPPGIDD